ncbi:hypothetical protein MPDQ_005277, partial [Monascus purpureus]
MEIPQFTPRETQLAAEKRLKFQGTTKVDLHQIHFDPHSHWQLDQRNVDCLWMIFQEEQCQNLTLKHHIPAMSPDHIWKMPYLSFPPGQLQGLHSQYQIAAGLEVLSPAFHWWAINIYSDDIGDDLQTTLIEEYSNEKPPSDGEIYHKIRQYASDGNPHGELRWRARLCSSHQTRLDSLLKNTRLQHAFDG